MLLNNIDPVLFKIWFFEIRYYGLAYFIGFLLAFFHLKKNQKELNLSEEQVYDIILYLFIGIIFGARIFYFIFDEPYTLIHDPLEFFKIWHGGMDFFGSLFGVLISIYLYCNYTKINFYKLSDVLVFPATIALILGRIANFINGEIVGTTSSLPWCVVFKGYIGCRHPYQIYAAISHLVLLLTLFKFKSLKNKDGFLLVIFLFGYGILRFLIDFFRDEPRFFYLTIWQHFSLSFILFSLILYITKIRKVSLPIPKKNDVL